MTVNRRFIACLSLGAGLALPGCFETPVRERVEISFRDTPGVSVRLDVEISDGVAGVAVHERLATVRREHEDRRDPWTRRFDRLDPLRDSYSLERMQGEIIRVTRSARVDAERLSDLFYDTAIRVSYLEHDGVAELALYAGASQRATREQQSEYRVAADRFSQDLERYFAAMDELYAYLESHPERSLVIFAALVSEDGADVEDPDAEETELLDRVAESSDGVMEILSTSASRAYSFEEISSLVNDPFPAAVTILPGGEILEMEGFERDEATGGLRVPRVSLWSAFESLRGRWLSPDPLVLLVEAARTEGAETPSPETLAAERRLSARPDWQKIRDELAARLDPPDTFRAKWIVRHPTGADSR